jgi:hypothetical protein
MQQTPEEFLEDLRGEFDRLFKLENVIPTLTKAIDDIRGGAQSLNAVFGQNRQRVTEIGQAFAEAVPAVNRLGGSITDVSTTMNEIAEASRRNVVATADDISKLYAAAKVLNSTAKEISENFIDAGVGLEQIPTALEESIDYIQSVGGNVSQIFEKVLNNTEMLNRFQFENGVQGLTKMAAQASMLRFNMNETFILADKVLDPAKAIEVASAFQRLGVSAGNLVDPFQLMNMSINDPQGLQDSLIDVSKQFTYFDEKTKTFKINPQGVLTLREIGEQTGVSAKELTKMGLAAAELDARLSEIKPNIKFENEEDRQYLANIAKMGEGGEYEVKIFDEQGKEQTKKLSDVTQTEMDKLIKQQKDADKSLEELQRTQLTTSQLILGDVRAIMNKVVFGVTSASPVINLTEDARGLSSTVGGSASDPDKFSIKNFREGTEDILYSVEELIKNMSSGKDIDKSLIDFFGKMENRYGKMESGFYQDLKKFTDENRNKLGQDNKGLIEQLSGKVFGFLSDINPDKIKPDENRYKLGQDNTRINEQSYKQVSGINYTKINPDKIKPDEITGKSLIEGRQNQMSTTSPLSNPKIEIGGESTLIVKHEFPPEFKNLNEDTIKKLGNNIINSPQMVNKIMEVQGNFKQGFSPPYVPRNSQASQFTQTTPI